MNVMDVARQCAEAAQGYRAQLEAMGFSPTAAEQAALHLLLAMQQRVFEP